MISCRFGNSDIPVSYITNAPIFHTRIYRSFVLNRQLRLAITVALGVTIALSAFLIIPIDPVDAASRTFTRNTTIASNQTINPGETWTINPGVALTISEVTINNKGTIRNEGKINVEHSTIINNNLLNNSGYIIFYGYTTVTNNGTIHNGGGIEINYATINNNP